MGTCFVIQVFDGDVYDKRYEDVFAPAIKDAGLEPYRVDRDPGAGLPINEIEAGIRRAQLCFAEISTDNPNVWFELGFAIAAGKEVVLVCSEERKSHFPFDVQHRNIIKYRTGAPQDFMELRKKITDRMRALQKKQEEIGAVSSASPVKDIEGLTQHEIVALVTIMQNQFLGGWVANSAVKRDMNKAGFTDIAVSLAIRMLLSKKMLDSEQVPDQEYGESYTGYRVVEAGEAWLLANQERLVLKKDTES